MLVVIMLVPKRVSKSRTTAQRLRILPGELLIIITQAHRVTFTLLSEPEKRNPPMAAVWGVYI